MELIWTPIKSTDGGFAEGIEAGPFHIDTSLSTDRPFYVCMLYGPGNLRLACTSVSDAMDTATAIADDMEDEAPKNRRKRRQKTGLPDNIRLAAKSG